MEYEPTMLLKPDQCWQVLKNNLGEDRTGALLKPYTHEWQVIS